MQVKLVDGFIFVKTPFLDRDFVQTVLNGVYSKKEGMNRFPRNIHAMRELAKAYPILKTNPTFMEAGLKLKASRERFLAMKGMADVSGLSARLRPYQRVDVEYLSNLPAAGIFNEPRTGKTPISILLIEKLGSKKNLIITPASLIWNWAKEFADWLPHADVYVAAGSPKKRQDIYERYCVNVMKTRVLIISKDTWKSDMGYFNEFEFDTCFVDEAHYLRSLAGRKKGQSSQANAICAVKAERRYALTGTPTVKHAKDIYGILHFLYPKKFNSYWQFAERYFVVQQNEITGALEVGNTKPEREAELQELIGFISVQRKRKEVMSWLPDKERVPFYVKMEGKQAKLYKSMADNFMAQDDEVVVDTANVLAQLTRLRQICLDPRLLGFDAESAKTKALIEWLDDNREPVVLMSMFTSYFDLLQPEIEKLGLRVGLLHGDMTNAQKEQGKADFQAGATDVILTNIITGGMGHTLDRAETIIFTDKAWNPSDNEQAEDRITPVTEDRNHKHTVITFQCQDSYDQALNGILDRKKSITDIINEGGRAAIKRLLAGGV